MSGNPTTEPDPRARDLALYLAKCNDLEIVRTEMWPWMVRAHFVKTDDGRDLLLSMGGMGAYELSALDEDGAVVDRLDGGHVEMTPVGEADLEKAMQIGRAFTGQDLEVKQWFDFAGIATGRHMVPRDPLADHSFMLLEMKEGQYSMTKADNPEDELADFEEVPFAEATEEELMHPDVGFEVTLSITDPDQFSECMGGKAIGDLTSEDFMEHLFIPGSDLPREALEAILENTYCPEFDWDGSDLTVKVVSMVKDRAALVAQARSCYESCWGDDEWYPASASEAFYELLLASNANPSPDEMGFQIMSMLYLADKDDPDADEAPEP